MTIKAIVYGNRTGAGFEGLILKWRSGTEYDVLSQIERQATQPEACTVAGIAVEVARALVNH